MVAAQRRHVYHDYDNVLDRPPVSGGDRSGAPSPPALGSDGACSGQRKEHGVARATKHIAYPNWIRFSVAIGTVALCVGVLVGLLAPSDAAALSALVGASLLAVSLPSAERTYTAAR
jgi:hypothetical protein